MAMFEEEGLGVLYYMANLWSTKMDQKRWEESDNGTIHREKVGAFIEFWWG